VWYGLKQTERTVWENSPQSAKFVRIGKGDGSEFDAALADAIYKCKYKGCIGDHP